MAKVGKPFTSKTGKAGGQKSKRKPLDKYIADNIDWYMREKDTTDEDNPEIVRTLNMISEAVKQFKNGNPAPFKMLWEAGFGKPNQKVETVGTGDIENQLQAEDIKRLPIAEQRALLKTLKKLKGE